MSLASLTCGGVEYRITDLPAVAGDGLARLPWIHRVVLENLVRLGAEGAAARAVLADWLEGRRCEAEIAFHPHRLMMHDTTCGPALVDIAACRSVLASAGADPSSLNPVLPVDVSTDHSLVVEAWGAPDALARNLAIELERNRERYGFMKWASGALGKLTVHPPGSGIMHTLNLERLASVAAVEIRDGRRWLVPDTLVGADSHTPMVGGLGVLAWGVGGLEAESVMFGMPVTMRAPEVVGVRLSGRLREGVLATDLALTITHRLRAIDIGGRFVEFFGPGVSTLSAGERAVVANMAPEYGAATGYFPVDGRVLDYLSATGRPAFHVALVERYAKRAGLWFDPAATPLYAETVEIDLDAVRPTLAGPTRPQDALALGATRAAVRALAGPAPASAGRVAIAAIASCTNTSDPRLLAAAGLVARKARRLGLAPKPWVKTSLTPGSPAAARYLERSGLLADLESVGFAIAGYGCATCIGASGPLAPEMEAAIATGEAAAVAVLSGNRNFPGRIHPLLDAAFLASPPVVVAAALAGDLDRDLAADPIGATAQGAPVRLADLWPSGAEIDAALAGALRADDLGEAYDSAEASRAWKQLSAPAGALYPWDPSSTFLRPPPFADISAQSRLGRFLAHPILVLGDDITTDHISPAGAIAADGEAGRWLVEHGEAPGALGVYSARRGNWEVMVRGLFTNPAVRNRLAPDLAPGWTREAASGEALPLWSAAERYRQEAVPLVLVAGARYGAGSSRDWAAKGVALLGVRAVLATGFERIHRSNLVNMGVLPLRLPPDRHPDRLALETGDRIEVDARSIVQRGEVAVAVIRRDGRSERLVARAEVETTVEVETLTAGGMLPMILRSRLGG